MKVEYYYKIASTKTSISLEIETNMYSARSPDLTPCDFFLWGYLKEQVYQTDPTDIDALEISIRHTIQHIPADFIRKACHSVTQRIDKLIKNKGRHIEI